ncbi:MAG: PhoH family protein [Bradymonadia bacterium]
MTDVFVLDTNVLLHDPRALYNFANAHVVLPIYVVEELDQFKKAVNGLGRNARATARELDQLRNQGCLSKGVSLENGATFRVVFLTDEDATGSFFAMTNQYDNLILRCALQLARNEPDSQITLVTKDTNLRIRADAIGLVAKDYDPKPVELTTLYKGHRELLVDSAAIRESFREGLELGDMELNANEYVTLVDESSSTHRALAKFDSTTQRIIALPKFDDPIWGITPRNPEQLFALDLLMNDKIKMVTLVGKAGTGKTLLALAAGLCKTTEEQLYQRVLVSRPIFPLGRDIGFLPGTVEEKLGPWMKPIYDNVEFLMGLTRGGRRRGQGPETLVDMGVLEIEPLTYIRGRSIPRQFLIVDEAQNLTPHEAKTILTRAGEGTKVIFTGDPYQIDNPYVDSSDNGLVHLVHRFRDEPLAGTVTLMKGERSELAERAANIL